MDEHDFIAVGEVIKTQGIRGEVKVIPLTDDPQTRFKQIRRIFWKTGDNWRELLIEGARVCGEFVFIKFTGIDTMTEASLLGRGLLYIPRCERPKLPAGRYYEDEIIGLQVWTQSGAPLGTIIRIYYTGANDVYEIQSKTDSIMLPALKQVIISIDLEQKRMVVELPPGLLEDEKA